MFEAKLCPPLLPVNQCAQPNGFPSVPSSLAGVEEGLVYMGPGPDESSDRPSP